ncbi:arthrodial cuticle protein AMP16.5 [Penaeus vannamei]|uniref:Arthrodial cuticle protein AMP16.5 n=1 Tax=Penaeus vannamei TaxID=6689 RepID=A0A423SDD1_PENVA|nr:arthrodial cuticle protein AMP16.5 [Penaeus vannamei]
MRTFFSKYATQVILACLVGLSACQFNRPATVGAPPIPILYDDRNGPDVSGAYDFSYGTGNGIAHQESSRPTGVDTFVVEGSYSYTAPDGTLVEVRYIADENGFRAESPLIPTTPTPPLHSLRQIAAAQDAFSSLPTWYWLVFADDGSFFGLPTCYWLVFADGNNSLGLPTWYWLVFADDGSCFGLPAWYWVVFADGNNSFGLPTLAFSGRRSNIDKAPCNKEVSSNKADSSNNREVYNSQQAVSNSRVASRTDVEEGSRVDAKVK